MEQDLSEPDPQRQCKVMLVDDHAVFRQTLAVGLQQFALDVVGQAGDTAQCLAILKTLSVNVLVLDLTLPGMGGADLVSQVSRTYPGVGILILSAHPADRFIARLIKEGAKGYLHKSCSLDEVVSGIKAVFAGDPVINPDLKQMTGSVGSAFAPHERLSNREYQVMERVVAGASVTDIAGEMELSVKTVSTYRKRLLDKIGVGSTSELVSYAIKNGLADV